MTGKIHLGKDNWTTELACLKINISKWYLSSSHDGLVVKVCSQRVIFAQITLVKILLTLGK